ncbi:MAG: hypothetical protein RML94_00210 [Bacteroidia bacterium]|nr:hypothetical protein [Bacteroidia bacterium]
MKAFQSLIATKVYDIYDYIIGDETIAEYVFTTGKYLQGRWGYEITENTVEIVLYHEAEIYPLGRMNPALQPIVTIELEIALKELCLLHTLNGVHVLYKIQKTNQKKYNTIEELAEYYSVPLSFLKEYFKETDNEILFQKTSNNITLLECVQSYKKHTAGENRF